jgi:hypothetical protein
MKANAKVLKGMTMKKLLVVLLFPLVLHAQEVTKTGTTAATFLAIPAGPRALGMGGAFVSIADDPSAAYWNVAGLSHIQQNDIMFDYTQWFADIGYDYVSLAIPMGDAGVFGASVTAVNYGTMDVTTTSQPEGTGQTFDAASYALGLSYAKNLTEWFSIGGTVKYVTDRIWHTSANGMAIDVGTLFTTPFRGIRFGASISNFGTKMQMSGSDLQIVYNSDPTTFGHNQAVNAYLATDQYDMPLVLRVGLSGEVFQSDMQRLTLAVDASHPNDNSEGVDIGGEYAVFNNMFAIRGGYNSLFQTDAPQRWTIGAGVHEAVAGLDLRFDYAYQDYYELSGVHKFAFGILF